VINLVAPDGCKERPGSSRQPPKARIRTRGPSGRASVGSTQYAAMPAQTGNAIMRTRGINDSAPQTMVSASTARSDRDVKYPTISALRLP